MKAPPKILFSLVARGSVILAEQSEVSGNANLIAVRILERIPQEDGRVSYTQDRHMFHVVTKDGITFMCMAEQGFGRRIPFAFLDDISNTFFATYGDRAGQLVAYECNTDFAPVLASRMDFFSNDPSADAINRVKGEILQVKDVMIENIEKVLDRGEKLDLLVDKTEHLQGEAFAFRREARRARRVLWWKNVRMWLIMGGSVAAIIFFIVLLACGWNFRHC